VNATGDEFRYKDGHMRRLLLLVCSFVACLGTGCFFPADRGRMLEERVDSLGAQNQKLKDALKDTSEKLEQTTGRLQEALDKLDASSRTTGANIGVKVDTTIQDVAMVRGQLETLQNKQQELEARIASLGSAPTPKAEPEAPKKEELKRPDDPKEFLKLADDKAKAGENVLARKLYNEFLKKFPREDPSEAEFGIAESLSSEENCTEALYYYGRVIQATKAHQAPTALLRSSDCFKKLKMVSEAKLALETLAKDYPKSDAAKQVKAKLAELNKAPKAGKK
jgi:TolA-binding protein